MKPLVLALATACLAFAVAACGGTDGAESAGPVPSGSVGTEAPATFTGNQMEEYFAQAAEYSARADAICKTAQDRLEAVLAENDLTESDLTENDLTESEIALFDVAYQISQDALAELRALPRPEAAAAVNPVALTCGRRGWTQESVGLTRDEFTFQAHAICREADRRTGLGDGEIFATPSSIEAVARIEEEVLAELRALPAPEADRALLEEAFYSIVEQEIDVLREWAAAESAGDSARALWLGMDRVHLTHQRDAFTMKYGLQWCPANLPA